MKGKDVLYELFARKVVPLLAVCVLLLGMSITTFAQSNFTSFQQAINNTNWTPTEKNHFLSSANELLEILGVFYENDDLPMNLMTHMVRTGSDDMQNLLEQLAVVTFLYKEGASETDLFYQWNSNRGFGSLEFVFEQQQAKIHEQAAMFNNNSLVFPTNTPMNDPNWFQKKLAENQMWAEQKRVQQKQMFETQANAYKMAFQNFDPTQTDTYRYHQMYTQELERRKIEFRNRLSEWERKWNMLENDVFRRSGTKF